MIDDMRFHYEYEREAMFTYYVWAYELRDDGSKGAGTLCAITLFRWQAALICWYRNKYYA